MITPLFGALQVDRHDGTLYLRERLAVFKGHNGDIRLERRALTANVEDGIEISLAEFYEVWEEAVQALGLADLGLASMRAKIAEIPAAQRREG